MTALDVAIELSDLYESTGYEGGPLARLIDTVIMPLVRDPLVESDIVGISSRFTDVIDKVRGAAKKTGGDQIRTLAAMMKAALAAYVKKTHDAVTARGICHDAIMGGGDAMLTVTAAAILANALCGHHSAQAQTLMKHIADKLSGPQRRVHENSSGAAVSASAISQIAITPKKKKRPESIFAEMNWNDIQDLPATLDLMEEIVRRNRSQDVDGALVDPITAELVLSVHQGMSEAERRDYESRPLSEMILIAEQMIAEGLMSVSLEEC